MKELIITVGKDGAVEVETRGFKGKACRAETREIERALGKVTADELTPEGLQREAARVSNRS